MKVLSCKTVSSTLLMALSLGVVAGCGGDNPKPQAAGSTPQAPTDLKVQFMVPSYADIPNMNDEYWSKFQKESKSQLDVEWIPSGDYDTKFDLVLASGNIPEVIVASNITRPTLQNAVKQGAFWDLAPFLGDLSKYPNLKNNSFKEVWNYMKTDGGIYGVPRNRPQIDISLKMRKDWLDKFKLPVPTTLDEYTAALKTIVNGDPDGNGKKDTVGLIGQGFLLADGDGSFLSAFGGLDPVYDKEGGLINKQLTSNYTDMVAYFRQLYTDGILAKDFSAIKQTQAEEMYTTGRAASYARNIWRDYTFEQGIKKVQPEAEVISLPPMKGPGGVSVQLSVPFSGAFYISKKVPEEKVKQILDFFERTTTMEQTDYNYYGIEGVHYTMVDGQQQLTDLGKKQVTANGTGAIFPLAYNNKMKVINPAAPKAYNDAKSASVESYSKVGKIDFFSIINSNTWISIWPKYNSDWQSMVVKAIVGQISMDEYKAYVDKLNNSAEFKKAYQEFAKEYKEKIGS
ncbi:putative aldouronate transport system substrate-binding protein [Paenibacillus sp. 1_12]|uniref:extracellular solute-binding protein n=1 Tax=Paenibacillus sp. 1_12 TaxID=1566278 RepID=UPI0008F232E0|nr:extracellular solute-binding protein [Paenibacillus sp. 1_12]SFL73779.1 putative aldouronate transport system substrate-binding protein [Paenibacillus sp. 1_12]